MSNPRHLLQQFGLTPKKSLGQNFLHDPNTLARIIENADLPPDAIVLEIGPGTGALTRLLARTAGHVHVIETDERLRPLLTQELASFDNITYHWLDILKADIGEMIGDTPYYVVANLPYYITSAIIRMLLEDAPRRPQRLVLTVQSEVAERITAQPGDMSLLSVAVQFYSQAKIVMRLNPAVFWPRPDVTSAVVRLDVYPDPPFDVPDTKTFFQIVRAGFAQKRKQVKNSIAKRLNLDATTTQLIFETSQIDPRRRAETLTLDEWAALARAYNHR